MAMSIEPAKEAASHLAKIVGNCGISEHAAEAVARLPSQGQAFHSPYREGHDIVGADTKVVSLDAHFHVPSNDSRNAPWRSRVGVVACTLYRRIAGREVDVSSTCFVKKKRTEGHARYSHKRQASYCRRRTVLVGVCIIAPSCCDRFRDRFFRTRLIITRKNKYQCTRKYGTVPPYTLKYGECTRFAKHKRV